MTWQQRLLLRVLMMVAQGVAWVVDAPQDLRNELKHLDLHIRQLKTEDAA